VAFHGITAVVNRGDIDMEQGNQFAVTKFLATGSQVPFFAAITLRVQKPLSNSLEGLFWLKFVKS
jgi:succinate-acetate transporter protein